MQQSGKFPGWISWTAFLGALLAILSGSGFFLCGFTIPILVGFVVTQIIFSIWTFGAGMVLNRL
jgi:hypothetical protein